MKKIITIHIFILTLLFGATPFSFAQQVHRGQISLPGELVQQGDQLHLNLDANLSGLDLSRNRAIMLTPVLVGPAGQRFEYPSILVNGKVRNKVYNRALALDDETRYMQSRYYAVLQSNDRTNRSLTYTQTIPFQDWMADAHLDLREHSYCYIKHVIVRITTLRIGIGDLEHLIQTQLLRTALNDLFSLFHTESTNRIMHNTQHTSQLWIVFAQ